MPHVSTHKRPLRPTMGQGIITPDEANRRAFLSRLKFADTYEGRAPAGSDEGEKQHAAAQKILMMRAQGIMDQSQAAAEGAPQDGETPENQPKAAPPPREEDVQWATKYMDQVEQERLGKLRKIEGERARSLTTAMDVGQRIEEYQSAGVHHRDTARAMNDAGWNTNAIDPAYLDFLEENIQISFDKGDFKQANKLRFAKWQMVRYGANIDPNGPQVNWADRYLDDAIRKDTKDMTIAGQFSAVVANGMVDSMRMIARFSGVVEGDRPDDLQRVAKAISDEHPVIGGLGFFVGAALDPGWMLTGSAVAKLGAKALAAVASETAVRARYAQTLIDMGRSAEVATEAAAKLTPERQAVFRLGQWAKKVGAEKAGVSISENAADSIGRLMFTALEGSVGNAAIEAGVASSEKRPLPEVLQRTFVGAAMGMGFGIAFDRGIAGGARVFKAIRRMDPIRKMPEHTIDLMEDQIHAAREANLDNTEIDGLRERWVAAGVEMQASEKALGRKLTNEEGLAILASSGIDQDLGPRLRQQAEVDRRLSQQIARTSEDFVQTVKAADEAGLVGEFTSRFKELEHLRETGPTEGPSGLLGRFESRIGQLEAETGVLGEEFAARFGREIAPTPDEISFRPTQDQQSPGSPEFNAAQARVTEIENRLFGEVRTPEERSALFKEHKEKSDEIRSIIESPSQADPPDAKLMDSLTARISGIEEILSGQKDLDASTRIQLSDEMDKLRGAYPAVASRLDAIANGEPPIRPAGEKAKPASIGSEATAPPSESERATRVLEDNRPILSSNEVKESLRSHAGLKEDQSIAVNALLDARANAWAKETGGKAEDWYATRIAAVLPNGAPSPAALFHSADDGFRYRSDYRPDPETELPKMRGAMRARTYPAGRVVHTTSLGSLKKIAVEGIQPTLDADGDFSVWGSSVNKSGEVVGGALSYGRGGVPAVLVLSDRVKLAGAGDQVISSPGKSYIDPADIDGVFIGADPQQYTLSEAIARLDMVEDGNAPKVLYQEQPDLDISKIVLDESKMGFFRKSDRVIDKIKGPIEADRLEATLKNAGISPDEVKWTGLADLIEGAKAEGRALSPNEIKTTIADDGMALVEHVRGGDSADLVSSTRIGVQAQKELARVKADFTKDILTLTSDYRIGEKFPNARLARWIFDPFMTLQQRQVSMGLDEIPSDLIESFLGDKRLQSRWDQARSEQAPLLKVIEATDFVNGLDYQDWSTFGGENYREFGLQMNQDKLGREVVDSQHLPLIDLVAHARTNDFYLNGEQGGGGERGVLLIEELQSDGMQEARKGTREPDAIIEQLDKNRLLVPEGPFKKKWPQLTFRRMLRIAAEEGKTHLAWTTGEQQIARYEGSPESEGLATFYDTIVPQIAAKIGKAWGVEPGKIDLFTGSDAAGVPDTVEAWSLQITDEMRGSVLRENQPLWQRRQSRITASTEFINDGRAVLRFFEHSDLSSAVHEIGHVFRRDLSDSQRSSISKWAGVKKDGVWHRKAEEKFARGFERYLRDGQAPNRELRGVFEKMKMWLRSIYQSIRTGPLNVKLTPEVRRVFDDLLGGPDLTDTFSTPPALRPKPPARAPKVGAPARKVSIDTPAPAQGLAKSVDNVPRGTTEPSASVPAIQPTGRQATEVRQVASGKRAPIDSPQRDSIPAPQTEPIVGSQTMVQLPEGKNLSAEYMVVSASDLIPSHDARNSFEPNRFGDPNERNYRDPTEGAPYRKTVLDIADNPIPDLLLTDTPTATDGPPIVTPDQVVLGGNARSMAQQLIYQRGGARSDLLRGAVRAKAETFGIDPARLDEIADPVLVRRVADAGAPGELSRILNEALTTPRTADTDAVSRGRKLTPKSLVDLSAILGDGTLREALGDPKKSDSIVLSLVSAGAFSASDFTGFKDQRGLLNQSGRDLVERTLVGAATGDVRRMAEAAPAIRQKLVAALPSISTLRARSETGRISMEFSDDLRDALDTVRAYQESGARSIGDLLSQGTMFEQPWRQNDRGLRIAQALLTESPHSFKRKLRELAEAAEGETSGQGLLMAAGDPAELVSEVMALNFPHPLHPIDGSSPPSSLFDIPRPKVGPETSPPETPFPESAPSVTSGYNDTASILVGAASGQLQRVPILNPLPPPELIRLAKEILGKTPGVKPLRGGARGVFMSSQGAPEGSRLYIDPSTAVDPVAMARTLAHEIGHLIDFLPEGNIKRGNLSGRLLTLRKHLKDTVEGLDEPSNKRVRKELKALSQYWKPYDPKLDDPKYVKYREKSVELYADALSVWLNSPGLLQERAPEFSRVFMANLDRKPSVLAEYLNIQDLLGGTPEQLAAARRADIRESFHRGDEIILARQAQRAETSTSLISRVRFYMQEKGAPTIARENALLRKGISISEEESLRYALDELERADNVNHVFLSNVERDVFQPFREEGGTLDDFGEYMLLRRIVNERKEIPNPYGHTPETATEQLSNLRRMLGAEKTKVLEDRISKFDDMIFEAAEEAVNQGVYNRETFETVIEPNRGNYATFAVLDHLEASIPAAIHEQVGTFKDVANPFVATVMKTMSLNRVNELNKAKNKVRNEFLKHIPEEMAKIKVKPGDQPRRAPRGRDYLVVLENGHPAFYETDAYVAKAFKLHDIGALATLGRAIQSVTYKVFHPLFVTYNPGWIAFNLMRDPTRSFINLSAFRLAPGSPKPPSIAKFLKAYLDSNGAAWDRARKRYNPLIQEMMENKALSVPFAAFDYNPGTLTYDNLLRKNGLLTSKQARNKLVEHVRSVFNFVEGIGVWSETLSKVAAYKLLTRSEITGKFRSYAVNNYFATPNFRTQGAATSLTNGLFMYSNIITQGLIADAKIAFDPKTAGGRWIRSFFITYLPKLAMRAGQLGVLGAGAKAMFDMIPEYDKANYIVVPFGTITDEKTGQTKTKYLRLPHDDTDRFMAMVFWRLSGGESEKSIGDVFGQLPFGSWSPGIDMAHKWKQYAQGINPVDDFRGRQIISRDAWMAGGWSSAQEMIRYTTNQFGIASVVAEGLAANVEKTASKMGIDSTSITGLIDPPGLEDRPMFMERIVGGIPGISRLFRISDRGLSEKHWLDVREDDEESARFRLSLDPAVRRNVRDRYRFNRLGEERLSDADAKKRFAFNTWYRKAYLPLTKALRYAIEQEDHLKAESLRKALKESAKKMRETK